VGRRSGVGGRGGMCEWGELSGGWREVCVSGER